MGNEESQNAEVGPSLANFLIFGCLQSLGIFAILGNISIIVVLLRNKYLHRASFILMMSLAIADVLHGIVTTCHFYPPIVLRRIHVPELGIRIFNIVDWTAWAITLTHMSAICIDRLIAIGLYGRYNTIVTIPRITKYTVLCWTSFFVMNVVFFYTNVCCLIRPLENQSFYSFGYIETTPQFNYYVLVYTPVELITIAVLTVSNPITLYQLYKRHKRKVALRQHGSSKSAKNGSDTSNSIIKLPRTQWQRFHSTISSPSRIVASTMLLEMSMKMGTKQITTDVREMAARRASRQQQRILLQITVVAVIFYAYMTVYYVSYYSRFFKSTAAVIFNSFCYSFTHMVNPIIYFTLNKEMRAQLKVALKDLYAYITCKPRPIMRMDSRTVTSMRKREDTAKISVSYSETSPLFSANTHMKSTTNSTRNKEEDVPSDSAGAESAEIRAVLNAASDESESFEKEDTNKLPSRERSAFITTLVKALQFASRSSIARSSSPTHQMEENSYKGMKMSTTMQIIKMEAVNDAVKRKYSSMTALEEQQPLLTVANQIMSSTSFIRSKSSSSTTTSEPDTSNERQILLPNSEDCSDEEDIAFL